MKSICLRQARQFILLKQGLLGRYRFAGKQGALEYIRQAGCIQFDPVDICGKNAELTLQSRVKGFTKSMLDTLLYKDRALIDYPDKQLSIFLLKIGRILHGIVRLHGKMRRRFQNCRNWKHRQRRIFVPMVLYARRNCQ